MAIDYQEVDLGRRGGGENRQRHVRDGGGIRVIRLEYAPIRIEELRGGRGLKSREFPLGAEGRYSECFQERSSQ